MGEVPEGSHIAFVLGRSGWYVDNLTFVLSTGRVLGGEEHIGGDGGGLKHSLARLQPEFNVTNMHLQGVKGVAADKQMDSKDMEAKTVPESLLELMSDDDGESN